MPPEVLIIGGGPAGLSTALHLAQLAPDLKPRILVIEKARYPRHKLCAGALVSDAEVILRGLGLDVSEVPHVDAMQAHLDFAGKGLNLAPRGTHALRIIRRDELDAWLAAKTRAAGIELREGITVRDVQPQSDRVSVETDVGAFEAAIVVGADGSNGVTRRSILPASKMHTARVLELLIPPSPPPPVVARHALSDSEGSPQGDGAISFTPVVAREHGPEVEEGDFSCLPRAEARGANAMEGPRNPAQRDSLPPSPRPDVVARGVLPHGRRSRAERDNPPEGSQRHPPHASNIAYLDFFPVPLGIAGYTWDFPTQVKGEPMRCWGIYDANLPPSLDRPPLKQPLAEEMQRHGFEFDAALVQGHPIRWFSPFGAFGVPRVILVGDAAGADGVFGEGISMALGYGRIAAGAICNAIATGDYSFADYRRRILSSSLGQALTIRTGITHILYRLRWSWFQRFFWQVFKPVVLAVSLVLVLNWSKRMR